MFHVHLVKIGAEPVGVIAHSQDGYRFYAIAHFLSALEERIFESAEAARGEALALSMRPTA